MKFVKHALAIGLMGLSAFAHADSWLYGGGAIGQSSFESDDTTTFGFHVGTGLLPIIGIEAGYWQHGSFELRDTDYDFQSFYAAVKPSVDVGPVQLYARAGVHRFSLDKSGSYDFDGLSDDDGFDFMYGAGVEYYLIDMLSIGVGYQNFVVDDSDIDSFTLNATLHFL